MKLLVPKIILFSMSILHAAALHAGDGINCSKAANRIEFAICNSEVLQDKDSQLAKTFTSIKESSNDLPVQKAFLIEGQRVWIKARSSSCSKLPDDELPKCIVAEIDKRQTQLVREWGLNPEDQDVVQAGQLRIGKEVIPVNKDPENEELYSLGFDTENPISETSIGNDDEYPLFRVPYRMSHGQDEAALLFTGGRGGTMRSYGYDILISGSITPFKSIEFGLCSIQPGDDCWVYRSKNGFTIEYPALPDKPGFRKNWNFESGLTTESVPFKPLGPATMSEFLKSPTGELLNVVEFYNLVKNLPKPMSNVLLSSLTRIGERMQIGGEDGALYGQRLSDEFYAISSCGLYAEGTYLSCLSDQAFAFWDRKTQKASFAISHDKNSEPTNDRSLKNMQYFPAFAEWSEEAKKQFSDWQSKKIWESVD